MLERLFPGWADTEDAPVLPLNVGGGWFDGPENRRRNALAFPEVYGAPTHEMLTQHEDWQE